MNLFKFTSQKLKKTSQRRSRPRVRPPAATSSEPTSRLEEASPEYYLHKILMPRADGVMIALCRDDTSIATTFRFDDETLSIPWHFKFDAFLPGEIELLTAWLSSQEDPEYVSVLNSLMEAL